MQNNPKPIQPMLSEITETIFDSPGGKLSDRCKVIYAAYNSHALSLKDMTYALMQYERAEIAAGNIRTDRFVSARPPLPDKDAHRDIWAEYYEKLRSHQIALNKNYEGRVSIRKAEAFELALKDDDYDYSKAKEWGAYIVTGVVDGIVKAYLGDPEPAAEVEPIAVEEEIPF